MNKRQKKKLYKKRVGCNSPKQMRYRGGLYHYIITGDTGQTMPALRTTLLQTPKYEYKGRLFNTPGEALIAYLEDILKPFKEIAQKLIQNPSKEDDQYTSNTENTVNTARMLSKRRKK